MLGFVMGMICFYFSINIILICMLVFTQWEYRNRWRIKGFIRILIFGLVLIVADVFGWY